MLRPHEEFSPVHAHGRQHAPASQLLRHALVVERVGLVGVVGFQAAHVVGAGQGVLRNQFFQGFLEFFVAAADAAQGAAHRAAHRAASTATTSSVV